MGGVFVKQAVYIFAEFLSHNYFISLKVLRCKIFREGLKIILIEA